MKSPAHREDAGRRQGFPLSVAWNRRLSDELARRQSTAVNRRTIEDWWYDYQRGGFSAQEPKGRADKGQPRKLTAIQQKWILEQSQTHLAVPVKVLYRRWREQYSQLPALNLIYRFLREHELHTKARRQQLRQPLGGATQRSAGRLLSTTCG